MDADSLDWEVLDRLREGFLSGAAAQGAYWKSLKDLEQYDLTYGERIGWKWDAVLHELKLRGWKPTPSEPSAKLTILDWGCGSGIAGRRTVDAFGAGAVGTLLVDDHSSAAREFSKQRAKTAFPNWEVREYDSSRDAQVDLLVVSHVLNELSPAARTKLLQLASTALSIIWVEPGTHVVSRDLIGVREILRDRFRVVAPCTHSEICGLTTSENARHWCHYFAAPPSAIYADSDWVKFGQRAGIDLRSLPYSFLVLDQRVPAAPEGLSRIIGNPEHFKGHASVLSCDASGVTDLILQKRDEPELFKRLKRERGVPVYRWRRDGQKIKDAQTMYPSHPDAPTAAPEGT